MTLFNGSGWRTWRLAIGGLAGLVILSACETSTVQQNRYARYYDACDQRAGLCYSRCLDVAGEEDRRQCQSSCSTQVDQCFANIGDRITAENELRYQYTPYYGTYGFYRPGVGYVFGPYDRPYGYAYSRYGYSGYPYGYRNSRDYWYDDRGRRHRGYRGDGRDRDRDGRDRDRDGDDRNRDRQDWRAQPDPRDGEAGGGYGDWLRELQRRDREARSRGGRYTTPTMPNAPARVQLDDRTPRAGVTAPARPTARRPQSASSPGKKSSDDNRRDVRRRFLKPDDDD